MANSPKTQPSRRQFIQSGVLAAAGAGLAGSGSRAWARHSDFVPAIVIGGGAQRSLDQNYLPGAEATGHVEILPSGAWTASSGVMG